jgi:hypothetical protein
MLWALVTLFLSHATPLPSASYRFTGTTEGASVGSSPLSSNRKVVAMSDASIAADLYETLDVKVNLFSKLTFDPVLPVN